MATVPTKQAMVVSNTCYVSSVRTTLCDIMCTVNASLLFNVPRPADSLKPLTATLPYKTTKQQSIKKKVQNETLFQQMLNGENKQRMEKELKRDREVFFAELRKEKMEVEAKRNASATKIQALFRGYRKRRNPVKYVRHKKRRKVHSQNDMQDELCTLAAKLGLKPIDGLSLETRSKTSRRKEKIMNAAAFRIHRFMDMVAQRSRAMRRVEERRMEILNHCARVITRAVRYVKVKKFVKRCEIVKREQMVLKIQCRTRIFHARERVRARAKERHVYAKRLEAAIIIQRNLAPNARALNLARLAMVTLRTYAHIADEVVSFIESFLLESGINSAVDVFTEQISDKFEVVHPAVEERILDSMIFDAVVVEMHIWLEEQMLAILAENHRISEEKKKQMEMYQGHPEQSLCEITWHNLPMEYYMMENFDTPGGPPSLHNPAAVAASNALFSQNVSAAASRLASPNVGQQAVPDAASADASPAPAPAPVGPVSVLDPVPIVPGLTPPSVNHRNNFLRGSLSGSIIVPHSPMRSSITASFSISPQHYRNVMNRLSSIDMAHSMKYQAALAAANLAADLSNSASERADISPKPLSRMTSFMGSNSNLSDDGADTVPMGFARLPSVRFIDNDVVQSPEARERADDMLPKALESVLMDKLCVQGIAEGDEDDEEGTSEKILNSQESFVDTGSKVPEFDEEPVEDSQDAAAEPDAEATEEATPSESQYTSQYTSEYTSQPESSQPESSQLESSQPESSQPESSQRESSRQAFADFAEAFASMSITSVLNQFAASVVTAGESIPEEGSLTLHREGIAGEVPGTPHSAGEEYIDDGDNASDIASTYYDMSVGGSVATIDATRPTEEWEVCRDFQSMSLTEQEKREIDQLFKDTMHAFYKAKYRKASDVLECFLPILRKFPSSDPFHPDVARVQTTIKTIKARILFEQAQYADAKEVFDDALQHRIEVFGKAHFLCVELYYQIGEWHRAQAQYDAAEKYLHQASVSVAALIKMQTTASETGADTFDLKLWHAKNKVLIAQAELCKQSGQYYKASLTVQQLKESLKQRNCQDAETTRIQESFVCLLTSILCISGKYGQAISLQQELLDQRRYRYGPRHPKVATALCALGKLKLLRCDNTEASEMLEESLAMRREIYPPDHPAIAASLYAKALAFAKMGQFHAAAADMTHALEMRRLKLGSEHPSVAQCATALADFQTQMGDPLRAWKNHNIALSVFRARYGVEKHKDISQCLFNMACNAEARGSLLEAVAYHEQALHLQEAVLELFRPEGSVEIHLGVEYSKVHLARSYALVGRLEEAKGFMKDSVKNVTKILGNRNDLVAQSLCHLGELCKIRGNYADAKQLYALAFNVIQELYGDDHPMIATIMLLSSENLRAPGMYAEAFELETSAYDVRSYLFGADNIFTAMAVYQRGQLLRDSGKQVDADKQYIRAMHILLAKVGENNGLYGQVLGDYAECCRLGGKLEMSEKYFNRAIEIQKATFGEGSLLVAETVCNFTLLLMDLHHPAEAAEILRNRVVPTFEQLLGKAHPTTMYANANLALASQFLRFFQSQGSEEGSMVLEGVLNHPNITTFLDACRASSFVPDHPWLLRFTEGSQSFAGNSSSSIPPAAGLEADNGSVHSSVSISASFSPSGTATARSAHSLGPTSLESQDNGNSAFTPRDASTASRLASAPNTLETHSPSDSDSYSQQSYDRTAYSQSEASESVGGGSMSYSAASQSQASGMSQSYSQSYSQSQSRSAAHSYSNSASQSRRDQPFGSVSEYPEDADRRSSLESGTYQSGAYPPGTIESGSYPEDSYRSGSYPSGSSFPQSSSQRYSGQGSQYISQHSAVLEYGDDYSASSASASASVSVSLTPRGYRHRRNFSITPASSVISRPLANYEESTIGSWDQHGDEQVSLDEYFSHSVTLDDESVGSMHTMETLYD